jgi:hypothetical protein
MFQCIRKTFNFFWVVVAAFPLMVRGEMLGLQLVTLLVILQVSSMLLESRPCKVLCQMSDNGSLIAESICSFRELMRGRSVTWGVVCHCVRSYFFFRIRVRLDATICIDLKVLVLSGMAYRVAVWIVSARCLTATSISLSEQFPSKHWVKRLLTK